MALTILLPRLGECDLKGSKIILAQLLAYVTGTVNQELLLRNEYLAAENRILKSCPHRKLHPAIFNSDVTL